MIHQRISKHGQLANFDTTQNGGMVRVEARQGQIDSECSLREAHHGAGIAGCGF